MKIRKEVIHNQFKRLCDALGKRIATNYNDVGAWRLDYVACYGGYNIEEIINDKGAVNQPFTGSRMSAQEAYNTFNFALRAIQLDRLNGADSAQYWPSDKIENDKELRA